MRKNLFQSGLFPDPSGGAQSWYTKSLLHHTKGSMDRRGDMATSMK